MKNRMKYEPGSPTPFWRGCCGVRSFLAALFLFSAFTLSAQTVTQNLSASWQFRQVGTQVWYPATVPGTVHTDLLANGLIGDPFKDNNEKKLQWIERENWEYKTTFDVAGNQFQHKNHELFFEGLDTYAEVFLNGKKILDANNMFRSWRVDVAGNLKEKDNELRIVFTSPILKNDSIARANVKLPGGSDTSEYPVWPYTRKAAYHFGWDFAPRFVTCGIWKDIKLESWSGFILRDVLFETSFLSDSIALIKVHMTRETDGAASLSVKINDQVYQIESLPYYGISPIIYEIKNPKRWWPNGSGEPHLYRMTTTIFNHSDTLAKDVQHIGLSTIELVNQPDSIGTSFYFKVNGKPIFIKGSNYVPQDVFLPRVKPEQYVRLLKQVKDAGMNMLRVWGGGVYEKDVFYDLCDEYGIMIWQDFMFAGTMYPMDDLKENILFEITDEILRLEKHACLALWCGNNEIEVAWKNWGWQKQYAYENKDSIQLWQEYEKFFEKELPVYLKAWSNRNTPYVSTSPQSNWGTPENFNHGSMHYWGVWHGPDDFSGYQKNIGRFMVEWGFQSYPDYDLQAEYISPEFLALNSEVMKNRQKSYVGNGKITDFLQQYNFDFTDFTDFKSFAQQSQHLQALGYELALKSHIAAQPHCMGTLLWQLNDCWPGPSWSIINYNGVPKKAYQVVKSVFTE